MPIADPEESRRYQREWARRRRERELAGDAPPRKKSKRPKPRPVRIPKSLRGAHPIVLQARENHKARQRYLRSRSTLPERKRTDKMRAKEEASRLASRPHPHAPQLDVSEAMLPRALLLMHAVLKEAAKPHRKIDLVVGDEQREPEDVSGSDFHFIIKGEQISITIREETRGGWEVVEDNDDDWFPWDRDRRQVVHRYSGVLTILADSIRHRDANTWKVEDRLGYLFRELAEREQMRKRAERERRREQKAKEKREREERRRQEAAEREHKRLEPQRRAEAEARAAAQREQQAAQARDEAEKQARTRRDKAFVGVVHDFEHAEHIDRLVGVLRDRTDERALEWLEFARVRHQQIHPLHPDPAARPVPEPPPVADVAVEPAAPAPPFDERRVPPMPEALRGCAPILRQMRENAEAKRRHDRFEQRNSWMRHHNWDWFNRERRKLGTPQPHRHAPDIGVRYEQLRLALLALHVAIKASAAQGFRLGEHVSYRGALTLEWRNEDVDLQVSQEQYGRTRNDVTLHLGTRKYHLSTIDDLRANYEDIARRACVDVAERMRAEHAGRVASVEKAAERERESFRQRHRDLDRYRRETVDSMAARVGFMEIANRLVGGTSTGEHPHGLGSDGLDWIARHDLGCADIELPDFTPSVVPAAPRVVSTPEPRYDPPRPEPKNFWRKPWYARAR